MESKIISIGEIKDGDIIYVDIDNNLNNEIMGYNTDVTGTDVIYIIDDTGMSHDGILLVNGGDEVRLTKDSVIYKIGHYSDLIKQLN